MNNQCLSDEEIELNKKKFIELVHNIKREGFLMDALLEKLEKSDFYFAPASQTKHNSFKGGLVDHCINVYTTLKQLVDMYKLSDIYSDETLIIVSLFHDFYKMNHFEEFYKNEKIYNDNGTKRDERGRFDWISTKSYKVLDTDKQFIFGTPGETSEYMARVFCPLSLEESVSIIHCLGNRDGSDTSNVPAIYNRYTLALLLHTADMLSTYAVEK